MITFEKFKDIIVKYINFYKCEDQLRKMNIEIFESPIFETTGYYFDWLWEAYFTEDGCDTISWWAFEYHNLEEDFDNNGEYIGEKMEPGMWDKEDNVIPMVTIEDLWNYVKNSRLGKEEEPEKDLKETIKTSVKDAVTSAMKTMEVKELQETVGDEMFERIKKYFPNMDKLVYVDNSNEEVASIMSTKLDGKSPFLTYTEAENDHVKLVIKMYSEEKVGILVEVGVDDYIRYIWQG